MKDNSTANLRTVQADARQLVAYVSSLNDIDLRPTTQLGYKHMGAVLTDAILQAGLNYRTVVAPRVKRVIDKYPDAGTASEFLVVLIRDGANTVLDWKHPEKPRRLCEITKYLVDLSIESDADLRDWLSSPSSTDSLMRLRGIGPKTVDYLKNLVHIPTVAVDRHIRACVLEAGIARSDYNEIRSVVELAASMLGVDNAVLDHAIWLYMSSRVSVQQQ